MQEDSPKHCGSRHLLPSAVLTQIMDVPQSALDVQERLQKLADVGVVSTL
jgi:hypothetical protein